MDPREPLEVFSKTLAWCDHNLRKIVWQQHEYMDWCVVLRWEVIYNSFCKKQWTWIKVVAGRIVKIWLGCNRSNNNWQLITEINKQKTEESEYNGSTKIVMSLHPHPGKVTMAARINLIFNEVGQSLGRLCLLKIQGVPSSFLYPFIIHYSLLPTLQKITVCP